MTILTTDQKVNVVVKPQSELGKPAKVDGVPGWSVDQPSVVSLVVAPDGMSAYAFAGAAGTAVVSVSADADMTSGVREIVGTLSFTVVEAEATSLLLVPGTPEFVTPDTGSL